ncbi:MAG TPA: carbon-nitrogen family hydrolase [Actinocrinis sp.]|jgi:predicted amidohydrolase
MKAALIQLDVDLAQDRSEARKAAVQKVYEAARGGAELVVLPELWLHGGFDPKPWPEAAEDVHGETAQLFAEAAVDCGITVHAGSIVERAEDGLLFNTSLVFDPQGAPLAGYRKIHRFGFDKGEAAVMSAGEEIAVFPLCAADGSVITTVGLATCYDLRFPEMYRRLMDHGAETILTVAAWPARRREHWRTLLRARAIENQTFVLACAAAGTQADLEMSGHSMAVDPWGEILAEGGDGEQIVYVDFDPAVVATTRERFPVLKDRRL